MCKLCCVTHDTDRPTLRTVLEREHHEIDAGLERALGDATARDALVAAVVALRRHIYLEEEYLFPPLRSGGLMGPVLVMLREHGELWDALDEIDALLATDAAGEGLTTQLEVLLDQLDRHNAKEEPIVYAAADQRLDADAVAEINGLVETSALPDGWVCEQARRR